LGNHDLLFLYAMTNQRYLEKWFKDLDGVKTLASYLGEGTHYRPDEVISIGERFRELLRVLDNAPTILPSAGTCSFMQELIPLFPWTGGTGTSCSKCERSSRILLSRYRILSCTVTRGRTRLGQS
jgi:hypothetical protein